MYHPMPCLSVDLRCEIVDEGGVERANTTCLLSIRPHVATGRKIGPTLTYVTGGDALQSPSPIPRRSLTVEQPRSLFDRLDFVSVLSVQFERPSGEVISEMLPGRRLDDQFEVVLV